MMRNNDAVVESHYQIQNLIHPNSGVASMVLWLNQ